jgi:nucleoside-diphosphate kinase
LALTAGKGVVMSIEQTYLMIKPEIVGAREQKIGEILAMVNRRGFRILELATRRLDRSLAEEFYGEHLGKPFFPELVRYITSGPVVAVRLEREGAVARLRELIGATDPARAAPGTVRALFGASLQQNAVHGSANPEDSARELGLIFPES